MLSSLWSYCSHRSPLPISVNSGITSTGRVNVATIPVHVHFSLAPLCLLPFYTATIGRASMWPEGQLPLPPALNPPSMTVIVLHTTEASILVQTGDHLHSNLSLAKSPAAPPTKPPPSLSGRLEYDVKNYLPKSVVVEPHSTSQCAEPTNVTMLVTFASSLIFDMNKFMEIRYWFMTWEKVDDMKEPIFCCLLDMTNDARDLEKLLNTDVTMLLEKKDLYCPCDVDKSPDTSLKSRCKISKCLSEYMLYLLVMCPFMLPKGIGEFRFRDTCSETKRFFQRRSESISSRNEACRLLLEVNTEVEPRDVKGDKSKSVLFEACNLGKALKSLEMEMGEKWKMVSQVWVEALCYAASHCGWIQETEEQRKEKIKRKQRKEADKRLEYLIGEAKFAVS
ncbi:hypothetical protein CK203_077800 [Vitis vinifera]|uniref:Uncharacterized protein n=1 Tax=Vitis vinifera TaxID=29760 RepID=A0A438EWV3_VITVI|nr:hypothetical protein CK203_077800 [Vitis vinifera]